MSDKRVNIIKANGELQSLPESQVASALDEGVAQRVATIDDIKKYEKEQKYSTPGQVGLTAAESLARGLTFGLSTVAEKAAGVSTEDIAAREETNPFTAGLGEAAGVLAPALFTGGGSLGAKGALAAGKGVLTKGLAATPVGLLEAGGRAAEAATARIAGEGLLGKAAQATASGALWGGAAGAGEAVSEAALGDDSQFSAEALLGAIGTGALLGGGISGGAGLLGATLARGVTSLGKKIDPDVLSKFSDEQALYALGEGQIGQRQLERAQKLMGPDYRAKIGKQVKKEEILKGLINSADDIEKRANLRKDKWQKDIISSLDDMDNALPGSRPNREDIANKINSVLYPLEASEFADQRGLAEAVRKTVSPFLSTTKERSVKLSEEEAATIKSQIAYLTQARENIPTLKKQLKPRILEVNPTQDEVVSLQERISTIKTHLPGNKKEIAELEAQLKPHKITYTPTDDEIRTINSKLESLQEAKGYISDLEAQLKPRTMQVEREPWSFRKLHSFRRHLDDIIGYETKNLNTPMADQLRLIRNIIEDDLETSAAKAAERMGSDFASQYQTAKMKYQAMSYASSISKKRDLVNQTHQSLGIEPLITAGLVGGVTTIGTGDFSLGAAGAAIGGFAASRFQQQVSTLIKKYGASAMAIGLDDLGSKIGGVQSVIRNSMAALAAPQKIAPLSIMLGSGGGEPLKAQFDAKAKQYDSMTPDSVAALVDAKLRMMGPVAPQTLAAMRNTTLAAVNHIKSTKPKAPAREGDLFLGLDKTPEVADREMAKWLRTVTAAENPMAVIRSAGNGQLTREGADTLRKVYPALYRKASKELLGKYAGAKSRPLSSKTSMASIFLGAPVASYHGSKFTANCQKLYANRKPNKPTGLQSQSLEKNVKGLYSASQALEARRV